MYENPIKIYEQMGDVISEFTKQRENLVFELVAKVGIDVDKNELIRALQYDREQYSKGYSDGKTEGAREFAELLKKKFNEFIDYDDNGEQTFESNPDLVWIGIDEVLAKMQKEVEE